MGRGREPGRDGLRVLVAGLAEVGVEVDEARRDDRRPRRRRRRPRRPSSQVTASRMPSATTISPGPSRPGAGSTSHARLRSRSASDRRRPGPAPPGARRPPQPCGCGARRAGQQVEERHPDRDAVRDLLGDHATRRRRRRRARSRRPRSSGPGCMTRTSGRGEREALAGDPEPRGVLAQRRQQPAAMPLTLDPQGHDHVGIARAPHRDPSSRGTGRGRPSGRRAAAHASNPRSSVAGPHSHRSAPAAVSVQMFERATREWRTSPTITTFRPVSDAARQVATRIVYRSSSACDGWACQPSPPFRIEPPRSARRRGTARPTSRGA